MPEELKPCPLCGKSGIGPYPVGEAACLPGAKFYATTTCDHLRVEGMTEEEVIAEFNRRPREERLKEALRWYAEKAAALASKGMKSADYAMAVVTELTLDAGKRADAAIDTELGKEAADG